VVVKNTGSDENNEFFTHPTTITSCNGFESEEIGVCSLHKLEVECILCMLCEQNSKTDVGPS
jgi:hypothetical protein